MFLKFNNMLRFVVDVLSLSQNLFYCSWRFGFHSSTRTCYDVNRRETIFYPFKVDGVSWNKGASLV